MPLFSCLAEQLCNGDAPFASKLAHFRIFHKKCISSLSFQPRRLKQMAYCRGISVLLLLLLLLLILKKVGSALLIESDIHRISPKTPAPQHKPTDRKKRRGKIVEDYNRDRAAYANTKALALLLKHARPTPSNTGLARSFQRDTERGIKFLHYCEVLQRGGP